MSQKSGIKSSEMKYTCPESPPVQSTIKDHKKELCLRRCGWLDASQIYRYSSHVFLLEGRFIYKVGSPEEGREWAQGCSQT